MQVMEERAEDMDDSEAVLGMRNSADGEHAGRGGARGVRGGRTVAYDVLHLHVAVHEALLVHVLQAGGELLEERAEPARGWRSDSSSRRSR